MICRKNAESKSLKVAKTNKEKLVLLSKCVVCDIKNKSRFIKQQKAGELLSSLELKLILSKVPALDDIML